MKNYQTSIENFVSKSLDKYDVKITSNHCNLFWVDHRNVPIIEFINEHKILWVKNSFIDQIKMFFSCEEIKAIEYFNLVLRKKYLIKNYEIKIGFSFPERPLSQLESQNKLSNLEILKYVKLFSESKNIIFSDTINQKDDLSKVQKNETKLKFQNNKDSKGFHIIPTIVLEKTKTNQISLKWGKWSIGFSITK